MTYEHREGGIVIIYKKKKELNSYERLLIKTQPDKYIRKDPSKQGGKKKNKNKDKRKKRLEKENEKFWKAVDEADKNPKKRKKKEKRREELLNRYMKQTGKKNKKKLSKKEKLRQKNLIVYFDHVTTEVRMSRLGMNKNDNNWFNPSRQFSESYFRPRHGGIDLADQKKMSLLKQLEDQITASVHGDMFNQDLVARHYHGGKKQLKKDKKRHKKESKKGRRKNKIKEITVSPEYIKQIIG